LAGIGEDGRHLYTCPLCEAMCGLEIHVEDGRVASIRGNRDDTWSRGRICPKGATLGAVHEDPDRIRRPMIKVDGQWQEVSWAVVHTLFAEDLVNLGTVAPHLDGVDRMREVSTEWSPDRVAAVTGITADRIHALARELAGTERAVVYGRIGLCNQEFGSLASWLVDVVNILTGHFDAPGGSMFPRAAAWSVTVQPIPGLEDGASAFGRYRTRVRGAKEVLGQVPVSCLAEEIATPGEGQITAPSASSTSPCALGRSAIATARIPTASRWRS
jgi:anaerobic selenocysteine-containing dehydrogenase